MLPTKQRIYLILAALFSLSILASPVQADGPANFANCRLGIGGVSGDVIGYDLGQLKMGLYLDWRSAPPPGLPSNVEYIRTVRVHQVKTCGTRCIGAYTQPPAYTVSPDLTTLSARVAGSPPGSIWRIGNEIERRDWDGGGQDEITPELYATAFHEIRQVIKAADPTARIAIGSVILASPLRLAYLERVWNSYQNQYGYSMGQDIDLWIMHGFLLREIRNNWGADIPAGFDNNDSDPANNYDPAAGFLYGVADFSTIIAAHHNITYFQGFVRAMRTWMAAHGERSKPLLITEYGVLYTQEYGISSTQVKSYLTGSFDYLLSATDAVVGYPADENRLVQGWVWYSLNDTAYNGSLFYPTTKTLSGYGVTWKNYVTDPAKPAASQPRPNPLVMNPRAEPPAVLETATPVTFTLKVDLANSGNTSGSNVKVSFWNGDPNAPGSNQIGSTQTLANLPGCGRFTTVEVKWPNRIKGTYTWYAKVEPVLNEINTNDNLVNSTVLVGTSITYLPLILNQ
ncbi:MAG: hypothetical protein KJ077_02905 [Anaerolineae bacterium]|nr:hypothetical protein [Anaerolineae bacterium]